MVLGRILNKTFWIGRIAAISIAAALCCSTFALANQTQTTSAAATHKKKAKSSHKKSRRNASSRKRGQQKIDTERTEQIQQALIREHYMSGAPTGVWDTATQNAMQKYQADNGWQSKSTPDSRALIRLGLGPDQKHLLNPESAMTTQPPTQTSTPAATNAAANPQARPQQ